jgi:PAS domain S-box-containing protein
MNDREKTKAELIEEISCLNQRIRELEQDESERKRAAEALASERTLIRTIIDSLPDRIYVKDLDRRFTLNNAAHITALGAASRADALGRTDHDFRTPELADQYAVDDRDVMQSGCPLYNREEVTVLPSGKKGWLLASKMPLRDTEGKIIGVVGISRDITERKQAEEALKESEQRYHHIVDTVTDYIFTSYIEDGKVVKTVHGPGCVAVTGYSADEFTADPYLWFNMVFPEDRDLVKKFASRILHGKNLNPVEHRIRRKDGRVRWVLNTPVSQHDSSGALVSYDGLISDITLRKRAEEAMRESEAKYRSIIENMEEGYHEVDIKGNFTFFNESMRKIMGYEREQLLGMNYRQYADEENTRKAYQVYTQVYRTGVPVKNFEWKIIRKDGDRRDIEVSISLIRDMDGHPTGFRGIVRDTTDHTQAEEEKRIMVERLQRSEKMEALGQLAGGVAHDLNNVLGILSGYSELLLLEIPEGHRTRGHVEKILLSAEKGAAIIEDLLTLARRGVTASDVINLNSVVLGFLKTPVFEKMKDYHPHVTFRTEYDQNLLNIKGSPIHLEKTFMNLVSNAAESISGKGEVTIRTESRYLDKAIMGYDEISEGDYAVLTVSDTGMGIPAENREKIFEPFYTKKTMGRSGTGLGLAIVWGTVKDHNGYIDLRTEVGEGSTFTLYFPVTRDDLIAQQQKVPIEQYMAKGESVLVVDDIAEQRDVASKLLARLGYEVHMVSSGEEAVKYLKGNKADILVLDMLMAPGIDGLDTYQRVLEINPKQKAILVSGFSETDRVREAQKLGAGAYVKKPYAMEKIGMAVREELNRK